MAANASIGKDSVERSESSKRFADHGLLPVKIRNIGGEGDRAVSSELCDEALQLIS